jgi:hypothetical protein
MVEIIRPVAIVRQIGNWGLAADLRPVAPRPTVGSTVVVLTTPVL